MSTARHLATALVMLCLPAALPVGAYEIYKWVDEDGVVHYSESAPEETDVDIVKLEFEPTNPLGYDPADDYYSIENQAERIGALWRAIAEEKEAREEAERAAAIEERLAALERRDAAGHEPVYRPPIPGVFLPTGHQRIFRPHFAARFHGFHQRVRPRTERSGPARDAATGSRPGWPARPGSRPSRPGFGSPDD